MMTGQHLRWFFLLILLPGLLGCASIGTYNPATGRKELILIPTRDEVLMGQSMHKQLLEQYKLSTDPIQTQRVRKIGQRLAMVSDRQDYQYHFFLIEKDDLNAFTTPGGRIYVFSGLVKRLPSDDALAAVLAHEIGHCAGKHTIKKFQAALGYNIIGGLILSQVEAGSAAHQITKMSTGTMMQLVFSAYGRQDEYESDRLGLKYMQKVGYDLKGMIETLELLQKSSTGANAPAILRTHPHLKDRIVAVRDEIQRLQTQRVSVQ